MSSATGDFANPTPAGLVALGMACILFFALLTGRVPHDSYFIVGVWLLGGFVVQVIVAVIELKEGNISGGNVFLWFSAFFMFVTGSVYIAEFIGAQLGWHMNASVEGWAWIALSVSLILWTPAYFKAPAYLCTAICIMDVAAPMLTLMKLGVLGHNVAPIIGWMMLVAGSLGLLLGAAIVVNTVYGRIIIPCPGPFITNAPKSHLSA